MKLKSLPKKSLVIWEFLAIIVGLILTVLVVVIFKPHTLLCHIMLIAIATLSIYFCLFYFPLLYISCKFAISDQYFILKRGVLFNKTHIIKKDHISFISVTKDPLTPKLKLSTLIIVAPRSKLIIPFMNHTENVKIMQTLLDNEFKSI